MYVIRSLVDRYFPSGHISRPQLPEDEGPYPSFWSKEEGWVELESATHYATPHNDEAPEDWRWQLLEEAKSSILY